MQDLVIGVLKFFDFATGLPYQAYLWFTTTEKGLDTLGIGFVAFITILLVVMMIFSKTVREDVSEMFLALLAFIPVVTIVDSLKGRGKNDYWY